MSDKKVEIPLDLLLDLRQQTAGALDGAPASVLQLLNCLESYELQQRSDAAFALHYPNLTKETEVKALANEVFQFLEFLAERGVHLAKYGDGDQLVWAAHKNGNTGFIDDFYELDRKATEREREALLAAFIEQQDGGLPRVVRS